MNSKRHLAEGHGYLPPRAKELVCSVFAIVAAAFLLASPMLGQALTEKILFVTAKDSADGLADIWAVNPDGTALEPFLTAPGQQGRPKVSPDGTMLAYWTSRPGNGRLLVVDLATGSETLLFTINREGSQNYAWKHDNSGFYMTWPGQCASDIYELDLQGGLSLWYAGSDIRESVSVMDAAGNLYYTGDPCNSPSMRILRFNGTGSPTVLQGGDGKTESQIDVRADGSLLTWAKAASGYSRPFRVATFDPSNGVETQIVPGTAASDESTHFSPDGLRIVFQRRHQPFGSADDLIVVDADGSNSTTILSWPHIAGNVEWAEMIYGPADEDDDGVPDAADNCPLVANSDQADADGDGIGDVCDDYPNDPVNDEDDDGVGGDIDNCPTVYDPDQEDLDGDGQGDACDFDDDDDGVDDEVDNCPLISNSDQDDNDLDDEGDACDADDDNDTVLDTSDNCPLTSNTDQQDSDGDGIGDVCDADDDNDGVDDTIDNCPFSANPSQSDIDGDGLGDVCDADADGDGIDDLGDNCPLDPNSDQEDFDGDGAGDACDIDDDDDLVDDTEDNCPFVFNQDQADLDGDGIGEACDADVDGDGIDDVADNCPLTQNTSQDDADGDGLGDACDVDDDGDGIDDVADNCALVANPGQADFDGDGIGNACDLDIDGDGIDTAVDNCPLRPNPSQRDFDGDGVGNRCDRDRDGDGVRNRHDRCPFTPPGTVVAPGNGCSIEQLVPCDGPRGMSRPWRNHGQYMRALTQTAKRFVQLGLITQQEKHDIVSAGAQSQCGY
ncbi:MAG: thrombospondin type 3 repeat-containing protein [Acidobacteriota bacterium]